jgi:hypothetical protein
MSSMALRFSVSGRMALGVRACLLCEAVPRQVEHHTKHDRQYAYARNLRHEHDIRSGHRLNAAAH